MSVNIQKLPDFYHKINPRYWPGFPPIFQNCGPEGPSAEDRAEARELFLLLDEHSKKWYRKNPMFSDL